jgi:hypothetical protein
MQIVQYLIGDSIKHRNAGLGLFRLSQILHERTNGAYDVAFMKFAQITRSKVTLPASSSMTGKQLADVATDLRRDGVSVLPVQLTEADISGITDFAYSTPAHGGDLNTRFSINANEIPTTEARYYWRTDDLIKLPAVRRLVCEARVAHDVSRSDFCRVVRTAHLSL